MWSKEENEQLKENILEYCKVCTLATNFACLVQWVEHPVVWCSCRRTFD